MVLDHVLTLDLFLRADPIVKAVVVLLILASIGVWAIILDRAVRLLRLRRQAALFESQVSLPGGIIEPSSGLSGALLAIGIREAQDRDEAAQESRAERRERIERAMRATTAAELRALEKGLPFLATAGSAAPFIGLFGTVWGIMNSFQAIARSQDTSLAVVAPGIAEALFATAVGLAVAIPAVIGYNKLVSALANVAYRLSAAIGELGGRLTRAEATAPSAQRAAE